MQAFSPISPQASNTGLTDVRIDMPSPAKNSKPVKSEIPAENGRNSFLNWAKPFLDIIENYDPIMNQQQFNEKVKPFSENVSRTFSYANGKISNYTLGKFAIASRIAAKASESGFVLAAYQFKNSQQVAIVGCIVSAILSISAEFATDYLNKQQEYNLRDGENSKEYARQDAAKEYSKLADVLLMDFIEARIGNIPLNAPERDQANLLKKRAIKISTNLQRSDLKSKLTTLFLRLEVPATDLSRRVKAITDQIAKNGKESHYSSCCDKESLSIKTQQEEAHHLQEIQGKQINTILQPLLDAASIIVTLSSKMQLGKLKIKVEKMGGWQKYKSLCEQYQKNPYNPEIKTTDEMRPLLNNNLSQVKKEEEKREEVKENKKEEFATVDSPSKMNIRRNSGQNGSRINSTTSKNSPVKAVPLSFGQATK